MKALHELSDYVFVIVGVWLEKNRLAHLNKDLSGRVVPINADEWNNDDLLRVIVGGAEKLNILFPSGFPEELVKHSCGSVYLVREACHRACMMENIYNRSPEKHVIERSLSVRSILQRISSSGADYAGQIINLLGSDTVPLNEQESQLGLKDWVLRTLILSTPSELQKGISLSSVRRKIYQKHPQRYNPTESQVARVVKAVQTTQLSTAGQSILDYDRQDKIVRCVDKGLILWRAGTSVEKIENLIFEGGS